MSDDFNPYHKWLGIPLKDQPANHYRLLGIDLFEGDGKKIAHAALSRTETLRTYQLGSHFKASQQLLNQVAQAKVCLLDAEKKAAYDQKLRAQHSGDEPSAAAPLFETDAEPTSQRRGRSTRSSSRTTKGKAKDAKPIRPLVPIIAAVVVTLLIIGGGLTFFLSSRAEKFERERVAEIVKKETEAETERRAQAFAERKAKLEAEQKVKLQAEQKAKLAVAGRIYGKDRNGKKEGISASVHVDLNADDIAQNGEPQQTANKQGKFSFTDVRFLADANVKPQLIVSFSRSGFYRRIDPVPIHAEDFKEGAIEIPVELKRKQITISGVISILPKGALAEGITVYIDRNANQQPDAQEPKTQTDKDGNYKLRIPFFKADITKIEVRAPNASEYAPATFRPVNKSIDLAEETIVWEAANFLLRKLESPKQEDSKTTVDSQESRPQGNTTAAKPITNQTDGNPQTTDTPVNASENNRSTKAQTDAIALLKDKGLGKGKDGWSPKELVQRLTTLENEVENLQPDGLTPAQEKEVRELMKSYYKKKFAEWSRLHAKGLPRARAMGLEPGSWSLPTPEAEIHRYLDRHLLAPLFRGEKPRIMPDAVMEEEARMASLQFLTKKNPRYLMQANLQRKKKLKQIKTLETKIRMRIRSLQKEPEVQVALETLGSKFDPRFALK